MTARPGSLRRLGEAERAQAAEMTAAHPAAAHPATARREKALAEDVGSAT